MIVKGVQTNLLPLTKVMVLIIKQQKDEKK